MVVLWKNKTTGELRFHRRVGALSLIEFHRLLLMVQLERKWSASNFYLFYFLGFLMFCVLMFDEIEEFVLMLFFFFFYVAEDKWT